MIADTLSGADWTHLEGTIRWYLYLVGFSVFVAWETLWPRKELVSNTPVRWTGQVLLIVLASLITIWVVPIGAIEVAFKAAAEKRGLLPNSGLPVVVQAILGVLILDFVRFSQHWSFHHSKLLWRMHRIHHSDPDFDLTTGIRFHPIDPILSLITYMPFVWFLGVPPLAVVGYELSHLIHAFFSHANIRIPARVENVLRLVIVTPETHRIHHSDDMRENFKNYGEMFTLWDRLLGSYQAQPAAGHERMGIGMKGYRGNRMFNPVTLLLWPFYDKAVGLPEPEAALTPPPSQSQIPAAPRAVSTPLPDPGSPAAALQTSYTPGPAHPEAGA